ncbi:hypothetical protein [Salinispira pacifica]
MKRSFILSLFLILAAAAVYSQTSQPSTTSPQTSPILSTLTAAFDRGDVNTKLQVMQRAAAQPADQMAPLYSHALDYVVDNAPDVKTNDTLYQIALTDVRGLAKAGDKSVLSQLWHLFLSVNDNTLRIAILDAVGELGKGDAQTVVNLNAWIQDTALSSQGGARPDQQVILSAVQNLAKIADSTSYPVFLHVILAQVSDTITAAAAKGLQGLSGDAAAASVDAMRHLDPAQWSYAAQYLLSSDQLDDATKSKFAAGVLGLAVDFKSSSAEQQLTLRNVRAILVRYLTQHPTPEAANPLVKNFNLTVQEFDTGRTTRDRLLESIAALGASGSDQAAARLSDYLNLLNTYTENDRSYDTQVVLAVINNLKTLGKQVAYQPLFYATLLKYPQRVLQAAQDALSALQK